MPQSLEVSWMSECGDKRRDQIQDATNPPEKDFSLLAIRPLSGRKHQIRAHFSSEGHPVLGDPRYGPPPRPIGGAKRLMLHAHTLLLELGYDLKAEPGPDFEAVLASRRG